MTEISSTQILDNITKKNQGELEFLATVQEFLFSVVPFLEKNQAIKKKYEKESIIQRLLEPNKVVSFKVVWESDNGDINVNKGYRVQFNNALGPYKGGLRFDPSVDLSILKFLGFEQTFKNSLTGLPLGGGKGGSDFDPKGKSDREVMRFCQAFMTQLFTHIGHNTDVPAGDIGVGGREIGYLFGQYKKILNKHTGSMTGKGVGYGGSLGRTEATGHGLVYFAKLAVENIGETLEDKTCLVSGSGNVAQYAANKLIELGAKVVTMSDRGGYIHDPEGINLQKLVYIMELKNNQRKSLKEYALKYQVEYVENQKPWSVPADYAFPCATQNEIDANDAELLVNNGAKGVFEGSNMSSTNQAIEIFIDKKIIFTPGKASNAGGVAVSGLEMSQNSLRISWSYDEVDLRLKQIMKEIHNQCFEYGKEEGYINYLNGANIAGFVKVAEAMIAQGI